VDSGGARVIAESDMLDAIRNHAAWDHGVPGTVAEWVGNLLGDLVDKHGCHVTVRAYSVVCDSDTYPGGSIVKCLAAAWLAENDRE
jgi:hypothetical protein